MLNLKADYEQIKAPNGFSLLLRDLENGLISGVEGGWISIIQNALIYDTLDHEPDPNQRIVF